MSDTNQALRAVGKSCTVLAGVCLLGAPAAAQALPGVFAVVTGAEIAAVCKPWVATLAHLAGIKSAPQYPMAIDRATWQGEPVVAVVAETRARAEDALALLQVEWEDLPAVLDECRNV